MAAKKDTAPKTAAPAADKKAALETALAQIEKQFGKGAVMKLGANVTMQVDAIPTGSLGLDLALGIGGVPRGRIVEVYGPESSGKTTLALQILAEAQKMGGEVAFIDVEHALDPTYAAALGVDIDSLLVSQPDTGEQAMEICEALVRSGAIDAVVVDSVAAMVPSCFHGLCPCGGRAGCDLPVYQNAYHLPLEIRHDCAGRLRGVRVREQPVPCRQRRDHPESAAAAGRTVALPGRLRVL